MPDTLGTKVIEVPPAPITPTEVSIPPTVVTVIGDSKTIPTVIATPGDHPNIVQVVLLLVQ